MSREKEQLKKKQGAWGRIKKAVLFISFSDPDLEKRFLTQQIRDNLKFNRVVIIACFTAFSGYYLMNYILLPPQDIRLYLFPYAAAFIAFMTIFILSFRNLPYYVFYPCAVVTLLVVTVAPLVTLTEYRYPDTLFFHSACMVMLIISLIFIRISFYSAVCYSILYLALFEMLYVLIGPHSFVETLNLQYILFIIIVAGLTINFQIDKRERTNFVKLRIIVENRMRLSELKNTHPGAVRRDP
jgi:hypothetical protein